MINMAQFLVLKSEISFFKVRYTPKVLANMKTKIQYISSVSKSEMKMRYVFQEQLEHQTKTQYFPRMVQVYTFRGQSVFSTTD